MLFAYKAINSENAVEEGVMEAKSKKDAAKILTDNDFRIIHIEEKGKSAFEAFKEKIFSKPLDDKKIALFCRQIAILLDTEPLYRILYILEQEGDDSNYTDMIKSLRKKVEEGQPLYKALSKHRENFSTSAISLIKAGEESGELKEILERIANYSEKMSDAKEKLRGALIYPILLTCVTLGLATVMFTFVIPEFATLFESLNATLPLPTQIVISTGNFVSNNGFVLIISIILGILFFLYLMQYESFKTRIDKILLRLPLCGDFIRHNAWQNIAVTIAMLIKGGFRIDEALLMAADVSDNLVFKRFLQKASKNFEDGYSMTATFRGFKDMPTTHFQLIAAGEKSGRLEEVLLKAAELSEKETGYILKRIESMIGPALTLIIGAVVLFFVLSVALPIFNLTEII